MLVNLFYESVPLLLLTLYSQFYLPPGVVAPGMMKSGDCSVGVTLRTQSFKLNINNNSDNRASIARPGHAEAGANALV